MQSCANTYCFKQFETNDSRKRYCSRKCQIENNNDRARDERQRFQEVNDALKRNHGILENILGHHDQIETSRHNLEKQGFNFFALTGFAKVNGVQTPIIYDLGIIKLNELTYKIVQIHGTN